MTFDRDYYAILGINSDADVRTIKRAYRILARRYHPDVSHEADPLERFREIQEAYEFLLDPEQRRAALVLAGSLDRAVEAVRAGERDVLQIRRLVEELIRAEPLARIDYVEIYSYPGLEPVERPQGQALLALAVKFGQTRLIDNVILEG